MTGAQGRWVVIVAETIESSDEMTGGSCLDSQIGFWSWSGMYSEIIVGFGFDFGGRRRFSWFRERHGREQTCYFLG